MRSRTTKYHDEWRIYRRLNDTIHERKSSSMFNGQKTQIATNKKEQKQNKAHPGQYCSPTTMVIILSMGLLMGPKNIPPSLGLDLVTTVLPWSCHAAASFLTPFATDRLFVSCACHISSWGAGMRVDATLKIAHSNQHERVGMRVDATLIKALCNQH